MRYYHALMIGLLFGISGDLQGGWYAVASIILSMAFYVLSFVLMFFDSQKEDLKK